MTLEAVFASILDLAEDQLSDATQQATLPSWDSMAHINLITALEEVYGVSFSTSEIPTITSLGAARRLLRAKGAAV